MKSGLDQLFAQIQKKYSKELFEQIYICSRVRLFGVVMRILRQEHLTEDCLQEVYMKIWNNLDKYDASKSKAITWTSTIARNHALDKIRKVGIVIDFTDQAIEVDNEDLSSEEHLANTAQQKQVQLCLEAIKPEAKECILLAYFKGLSYREIANKLDRPESTIKTWVSRSFPTLKKCMEKAYD